ncbi:MAG: glycosyltransferase family 2 protein [Cyclobacteriaceae bacterium]
MNRSVSIITVNYNQAQVTRELLQSIERLGLANLEVIVVDNASEINPISDLQDGFPWVKAIRSNQNLGFAGGNNLGIKYATGNYLFFLNNDTEVPEGTIEDLASVLDSNLEAGVVNPLIYYYDQPDVVQFAGYTLINGLTGRNEAIGYGQKLKPCDEVIETPYAHGAAMMVRREVIEDVGGMPENYFLYYEELDWGQQIRNAGYKMCVSHRSKILHKESISTGKDSPLKTYFQTRNRLLFMRRNYEGFSLLLFFVFFGLLAIPKSIFKFIRAKEWQHLRSFQAGVKWNLFNDRQSNQIGYIYDGLRD